MAVDERKADSANEAKQRIYMCIDMKSFYASVECAERGLDPFETNLIVADESRGSGTICLAVCCATAAGLLAVHLAAPQLYETSALGGWVLAFTGFGGFFVRELVFLLQKRKGEVICGIAA